MEGARGAPPNPYKGRLGCLAHKGTCLLGAAAKGEAWPPSRVHQGFGPPLPYLVAWALGLVRPAHMGCCTTPPSTWTPHVRWAPLWNLSEPSRNFRYPARKFPNLFDAFGNHFPYMNFILWTLPELLVMSRISSETPNQYSFIPSNYLIANPSYIGALSV